MAEGGGESGDMAKQIFTGVFPIAPTTFDERGELDLASQKRTIDFMVDAKVDGICILANYSEQFALTDAEREQLIDTILTHAAGRVPIIVTTTHYSTRIAAERSKRAQQAGAAMVMLMPPITAPPCARTRRASPNTSVRWPRRSTSPSWCRTRR